MLDYLQEKTKKFGSLDKYMDSMDGSMKREFMAKLSDTVMRIHILFWSRQVYWQSKKKSHTAILAIFSIILVVIFIVFAYIVYKRQKIEKLPMQKTLEIVTNYIIVYMIILTIFIALLTNAKKMQTFCQREVEKSEREGETYSSFMFQGSKKKIERTLFKLAYAARGKLDDTGELLAGNVLATNELICKPPKKTREGSEFTDIYNCETQTPNYEKTFESMREDLKLAMKRFVSGPEDRPNIDGYIEVRQMYIVSSPVPMLKETKRIVDSYYNLTLKEKHGKDNKPPDAEKQKAVIKTLLIDPMSAIMKQTDDVDPDAYSAALLDEGFKKEQEDLRKLFLYAAAYAYQIYVQKLPNDPSFPSNVKNVLPSTIPDVNDPFRIAFVAQQASISKSMKFDARDSTKISSAIADTMVQVSPAFEPKYNSVLRVLGNRKVNGSFMFDKDTVQTVLMDSLKSVPEFNDAYVSFIKDTMYTYIVLPLKARVNLASASLGMLVESSSTALAAQNITITKFNDYIMAEVTKGMRSDDLTSKVSALSDTLSQIAKSVAMKRQLKKPKGEERFLDDADFVEVLDNTTFSQFKNMLETENISYVVNEFYKKISEAVNLSLETSDNLYFTFNKRYEIWRRTVIMASVTIVLIWLKYAKGLWSLKKYLHVDLVKKLELQQAAVEKLGEGARSKGGEEGDKANADLKAAQYQLELVYREMRNRSVNWYIRMIVPACFVVFVISMMFAVLNKAGVKNGFNVDMIESNTSILRTAVDQLRLKVGSITVSEQDSFKKIKDIPEITGDNKIAIYRDLRSIIEKFEKCNFILESQKNQLPFPYSEVAIGGTMAVVTAFCMLYVFSKLRPMSRLKNIRDLNKMKAEAAIADMNQAKSIQRELEQMLACHEDDIDSVVFTLKIVFFIFIVAFLIFYSTKVVTSSGEYKSGLYNSVYFDESACVE